MWEKTSVLFKSEKDMTGELHNVDKSVQIETNYNKCGNVDLHRFEVLTE